MLCSERVCPLFRSLWWLEVWESRAHHKDLLGLYHGRLLSHQPAIWDHEWRKWGSVYAFWETFEVNYVLLWLFQSQVVLYVIFESKAMVRVEIIGKFVLDGLIPRCRCDDALDLLAGGFRLSQLLFFSLFFFALLCLNPAFKITYAFDANFIEESGVI